MEMDFRSWDSGVNGRTNTSTASTTTNTSTTTGHHHVLAIVIPMPGSPLSPTPKASAAEIVGSGAAGERCEDVVQGSGSGFWGL